MDSFPFPPFRFCDFVFHADRKVRKVLFSFVFQACAGGVVNFVTTRERRGFIHPLPPTGYSPLSQGENGPPQSPCRGRSQSQPTCAHTILTVPLRQGARRGWIKGVRSRLHFHLYSPLLIKLRKSVFRSYNKQGCSYNAPLFSFLYDCVSISLH